MKQFSYSNKYFDKVTNGWNQISYPIISKFVDSTLKTYSPCYILDFGAGAGTYARLLSTAGGHISACDISQNSIDKCIEKYDDVFHIGKAADLPAEQYDMIFSTEVLEHIDDWRDTLIHFHRALTSQGIVLLTTTTYSPAVFTMLYQVKNSGLGTITMVREIWLWITGYFSSIRRDQFIQRWCFEATGGHYHGFLKSELKQAFLDIGFSVEASGVFYAIEPIQMSFLHSYTLQDILSNRKWSVFKRIIILLIYAVGRPTNSLLKTIHLFANNIYFIAKKK